MSKSLQGVWAVVTRPEQQADGLCQAIEAQDGHAIRWPVLSIDPIAESTETRQHIDQLPDYDFVIFISANAVNFGLAAIKQHQQELNKQEILAVGKATATALRQAGIDQVKLPEIASGEGLLAMPELDQANVAGKRCLIFRGQGGNEQLAEVLRQRELQTVDYAEVYRRADSTADASILEDHWQRHQLDIIIITSCAGVDSLFAILGKKNHAQLCSTTLLTISERVANYAQEKDFQGQVLIAKSANDQDIIETMQDWHQKEESI